MVASGLPRLTPDHIYKMAEEKEETVNEAPTEGKSETVGKVPTVAELKKRRKAEALAKSEGEAEEEAAKAAKAHDEAAAEATALAEATAKGKHYRVAAGAVTLACRRRVAKLGEVHPETAFVKANVAELVKKGYLKEVKPITK